MGLHLHEMRDTDKHFIIDPVTRAITNANAAKNKLIQFDHNSEIFTFEIPQYVDGHDMNKCDKVEIHYINIDGKTKEQSKDLFNAKAAAKTDSDLVFNLEGEKLLFCWKISGNATKYSGSLNFLVCFSCLDDAGAITYKWHTDIFKGITISDGLSNTEAVAEQYSDVLEQWKKELENASGSGSGSGGSIGGNMTDDGDLVLTYSSQSSGGGGDVTEPETPTITGIVATYGGGDVPKGTSLLNLKNVTAIVQYSDGSTGSATDGYTLSLPDGALTLSVGVNTVTAEYKGFTATFEVTAYESGETVESIYDSALYDVSIYSV